MKLLKTIVSAAITVSCFTSNVYAYNESAVLNTLRLGIENYMDTVDISPYEVPVGDVETLATKLLFGQPKYFYVSKEISSTYYPSSGMLSSVSFKYTVNRGEVPAKIEELNSVAKEIIQEANKYNTDYQKLLYVHDWFVKNIKYDYTYQNHDMYSALVDKSAVCEGIAYAYSYILNNLGINNTAASSETMNHMWNVVELDGKWYNVDLTSDISNTEKNGYSAAYFLKSDAYLKYYEYTDWTTFTNVKCTDTTYDKYVYQKVKTIKVSDKITLNIPYIMEE